MTKLNHKWYEAGHLLLPEVGSRIWNVDKTTGKKHGFNSLKSTPVFKNKYSGFTTADICQSADYKRTLISAVESYNKDASQKPALSIINQYSNYTLH